MSVVSSKNSTSNDEDGENVILPYNKTKHCRLSYMQRFQTPGWTLVILSLGSFLQGFIVNGLVNGVIATLINRFGLRTSHAGYISCAYDLGFSVILPFVTLIGEKYRKPLLVGYGMILMGCGSLLFSLPHFIAPMITLSNLTQTVCSSEKPMESQMACSQQEDLSQYRYVFFFGQFLIGCGSLPLFTLGITYIDENVKRVKSAMYHGIFYASATIGPGAGFFAAGAFLNIYTNIGERSSYPSDHPQFIGAWWLAFVISGFVIMLMSILPFSLPTVLPGTEEYRKNREIELDTTLRESNQTQVDKKLANDTIKNMIKTYFKDILSFLKVPTFTLTTLRASIDCCASFGLATFVPKLLMSYFAVSYSLASTLTGIITIFGAAGGQFLGGFLVTKFKLSVTGILKLNIVAVILSALPLFAFLVPCPNGFVAGLTHPYADTNTSTSLVSTCNQMCVCSVKNYEPVCGSDGVTYYTSCHAGCTKMEDNVFMNCSCVSSIEKTATVGACSKLQCFPGGYYLFSVIFLWWAFWTFTAVSPSIQVAMRVVPFNKRTMAFGLQTLMIRLLGSLPGPVYFGYLIEGACLFTNKVCGIESSCSILDNKSLGWRLFTLSIMLKASSIMCAILAFVFHKPISVEELQVDMQKISHEDEEEQNQQSLHEEEEEYCETDEIMKK